MPLQFPRLTISFRLLRSAPLSSVACSQKKNGGASNILLCVQSTFRVGPEMAAHPIQDLGFWYSSGPGQPTSAAQGIGYVQELVSRLTQMPITNFNSTVNGTIVSSNITFPLNQPIYVDASHDTVISSSTLCSCLPSMIHILTFSRSHHCP